MGIEGESDRRVGAGEERAASAPEEVPGAPLGEAALRRIGGNYVRLRTARDHPEMAEKDPV